jgi:hypothetical protein
MQNDKLIIAMRTLAKSTKALFAGNVEYKGPKELLDAVSYIENEIGLEGPVVAKAQRTDVKPEAVDSNLHANCDRVQFKTDGLHDINYLPKQGVVAVSDHTARTWINAAEKLNLNYSFRNSKGMLAISEEEILAFAKLIQAHRKLEDAAENLRKGADVHGHKKHEGTDAEQSTQHGLHDYNNWSDLERSRSTISLTITSGQRYLNGSMSEHQHYVTIEVHNPDGRTIARIALSPEQFASFLIGRSSVPCTLDHYWMIDENAVALRERVFNPDSILDRMRQRLNDSISEQDKDLTAIIKSLSENVGKPIGKKAMEELIKSLQLVAERRKNNTTFVVEQAMEEGSQLAETAAIRVLLAAGTGKEAEVAKSLATSFGTKKLTGGSQ